MKVVDAAGGIAHLQVKAEATREELFAQTGAEDATSVRFKIKESRKLAPDEVAQLVAAYAGWHQPR